MSKKLVERYKFLFNYNPTTGVLTRKVSTSNRVKVGDAAGSVKQTHPGKPYNREYLQVRVDGVLTYVHVIAFAIGKGRLPAPHKQIDHRDGDGLHNRLDNLREATRGQNGANRGATRGKRSGLPKGVFWHERDRRYVAKLCHQYVGSGKDVDEVKVAYDTAAKAKYGKFARSA